MSSGKAQPVPRPSASILLLSHQNELLLLHRVQTSSAFPSAHVFPGGNLSTEQDGQVPSPEDPKRHQDSQVYRIGAIRECFEESGILLARPKGVFDRLLELSDEVRESGRKEIHANKVKFLEWVQSQGGELDLDGLIPFTRWVTPPNIPKRFTTQMYIYCLPLETHQSASGLSAKKDALVQIPTHDGGVEHTAARFLAGQKWLEMAQSGEIILFPPQFFLIHLTNLFLDTASSSTKELQAQRDRLIEFVKQGHPSWIEKCISPIPLLKLDDGRQVLSLEFAGPELKDSDRKGESNLVVVVAFQKDGPRQIEIRTRTEVLAQARQDKRLSQKGMKL